VRAATLCCLILGSLLAAAPAWAQRLSDLTPGAQLRVVRWDGHGQQVQLLAIERDSLALRTPAKDTVRLAVAQIQQLYVKHERPSHSRTGFKAGVLAGAIVGLVLDLGFYAICSSSGCDSDPTEWIAIPVGSALVGGGIGAFLGRVRGSDKWLPVALR
jgi:hypothetical protein